MKKKLTSIFLVLLSITIFQNCSESDTPKKSEAERIYALLISDEWQLNSVEVDGVDQTEIYAGLALTFTDDMIQVENGNDVWPESQTWVFTDGSHILERGDGLQITIDEISTTLLVLSLHWDETVFEQGGRASIEGDHTFSFSHDQ